MKIEKQKKVKENDFQVYCSLDIETSGFDPLTSEILEVGFVFFRVGKSGLEFTEEWTQVFKPQKEVPAKILGLTGITQKELQEAPDFSLHKEFLQEKLGNAIIVGHNISFDINFLKGLGLSFQGPSIDTLELVQWLLPTHHSYNLENLMHYFKVPHQEAHRALADSKAAVRILEKLLIKYVSFPTKLKNNVKLYFSKLKPSWQELFLEANNSLKDLKINTVKEKRELKKQNSIALEVGHIYNFPLGFNYHEQLLFSKAEKGEGILLVLPKTLDVLDFWQKYQVSAIFKESDLFSQENFDKLLNKKDLSSEEIKFILKILVWQETNWQNICLLDLNLSFTGGQFKYLVAEGKQVNIGKNKVTCLDHETFIYLTEKNKYKNYFVVISDLAEFERSVSRNISNKVSWGSVLYWLKSFYNPELSSGNKTFKEVVSKALQDTDLFFGLVNALLIKKEGDYVTVELNSENFNDDSFVKIRAALKGYVLKMREANKILKSENITQALNSLESFFSEEMNRVKWIECSKDRSIFQSSPVSLEEIVGVVVKKYPLLVFADSLPGSILVDFFKKRLCIGSWEVSQVSGTIKKAKQQDLFSVKPKKQNNVNCEIFKNTFETKKVYEYLTLNALPAAVCFGSQMGVKGFYEEYYAQMQEYAFLFTQSASGGSNKIFNNFKIYEESILLVTNKFVLKYLENPLAQVRGINVKTLVVNHLPFDVFTHPYQKAVSNLFENPFLEYSLPRAVYNFHKVLGFFLNPSLENLYIADSKTSKDYFWVFKDYLEAIPAIKLKSE